MFMFGGSSGDTAETEVLSERGLGLRELRSFLRACGHGEHGSVLGADTYAKQLLAAASSADEPEPVMRLQAFEEWFAGAALAMPGVVWASLGRLGYDHTLALQGPPARRAV